MGDVALSALNDAVEAMHRCKARYRERAHLREEHEGHLVWEGDVFVFDLEGHPTASRCYAWSDPVEGTSRRRFFAVLHQPPVDSPEKAVRASIVQAYRAERAKDGD